MMRFIETFCLALVGLVSLSIAAPASYEYEVLQIKAHEPGPGYGL